MVVPTEAVRERAQDPPGLFSSNFLIKGNNEFLPRAHFPSGPFSFQFLIGNNMGTTPERHAAYRQGRCPTTSAEYNSPKWYTRRGSDGSHGTAMRRHKNRAVDEHHGGAL